MTKRKHIVIKTNSGDYTVKDAIIITHKGEDIFAVHRTYDHVLKSLFRGRSKRAWTVTHIPTGLVVAKASSYKKAIEAVKLIKKVRLPWNSTDDKFAVKLATPRQIATLKKIRGY